MRGVILSEKFSALARTIWEVGYRGDPFYGGCLAVW
jgi:hypothetical protein